MEGGNWILGKLSEDEWNRSIMELLKDAEAREGNELSLPKMLDIAKDRLKYYGLDKLPILPLNAHQ